MITVLVCLTSKQLFRMKTKSLVAITLLSVSSAISLHAQEDRPDRLAVAVQVPSEISIDGDLSEWDRSNPLNLTDEEQVNSMGLWNNPDDFSALAYLMWDEEKLYLASEVRDDLPFRYLETPDIDGVDALSLYINTDAEADPGRKIFASTDFRVLFAIDNQRFPTAVDRDAVLLKSGFQSLGMEGDRNVLIGYEVAVKTTDNGYMLELSLPFSALANERIPVLKPEAGMQLGFNLQFMDLDEATEDEVDSIGDRVSFITLFPGNPAKNPADWGFLEFSQQVNLQIVQEFAKEGIKFAFPTSTTYLEQDDRHALQVNIAGDTRATDQTEAVY